MHTRKYSDHTHMAQIAPGAAAAAHVHRPAQAPKAWQYAHANTKHRHLAPPHTTPPMWRVDTALLLVSTAAYGVQKTTECRTRLPKPAVQGATAQAMRCTQSYEKCSCKLETSKLKRHACSEVGLQQPCGWCVAAAAARPMHNTVRCAQLRHGQQR